MSQENCIFCKIIRGEIPNFTVYQVDHCLAFLDIHPVTKGHVVVIPKVHGETLFDLDTESVKAFFVGVKQAQQRVQTILSPDGFNIGWNHGDAGGQAIKHLHVHILPRWSGDAGGSMHSIVHSESDVPVAELAKLFE